MSLIPPALVTVNNFIFNFTAQASHLMAGYLVVSKTKQYGGHKAAWIVAGIGTATAAFKEFYWDFRFEDVETRGSSLLDFTMYATGIILGTFV